MTQILALATNNQGKVREIRELLQGLPLLVQTVSELTQARFDVDEVALTFEGNALLKAEAALRATGNMVMADDSGLEVDALEGRPGVRSARYAGVAANDEENLNLLLRELEGVPSERRGARFVCVMVLASPGREPVTVRGTVEGVIALVPSGTGGFGYDPVFLPQGYPSRSMAELTSAEKNAISHRAQALGQLRSVLQAWLASSPNHVDRSGAAC